MLIIFALYGLVNKQKTISQLDLIKSEIKKFVRNIYSDNNYSTIDHKAPKPAYTYKNLPAKFAYSGSFLFFESDKPVKLTDLSLKAIRYTKYFKLSKLKNSIKKYNDLTNETIAAQQPIFIPYSLPAYQADILNRKKTSINYTKGLYFSGSSVSTINNLKKILGYKEAGINTVVFDAKDIPGIITYYSEVPLVQKLNTHKKRSIDNIDRLIRILKDNKIYTIARIAVFSDHKLAKLKPEWRIRSFQTGQAWNAEHKEIWCDPTNKHVQNYNIDIALELAQKGVDEIQFDYIRFPTVGNARDAKFAYHYGKMSREETITAFLKKAQQKLKKYNTNVSIDIFGIVAWGKGVDIRKTGQRINRLAQYCDVISPMLYPSHFNDEFDGYANPGDAPYYFIHTGTDKVMQKSGETLVRPWLQAFGWRVSNYNADYILQQIKACEDINAQGYLFWNSKNNYDTVIRALKILNKQALNN
jgi:hypothetical protein